MPNRSRGFVPSEGKLLAAGSEERRLGPGGVVACGLVVSEPEDDVTDGRFAPADVDLPPPVRGLQKVPEVAPSLRLLDDQGAQVGEAVLDADGLQGFKQ